MTNFELIEILRTQEASNRLKELADGELEERIKSFDRVRQLYISTPKNPHVNMD